MTARDNHRTAGQSKALTAHQIERVRALAGYVKLGEELASKPLPAELSGAPEHNRLTAVRTAIGMALRLVRQLGKAPPAALKNAVGFLDLARSTAERPPVLPGDALRQVRAAGALLDMAHDALRAVLNSRPTSPTA